MEAFNSPETKVVKVKLFKNKSLGATSEYGFVDFEDHDAAERALAQFNGLKLAEKELKVNWANSSPSSHHASSSSSSSSHGHHHHNNHHHHHHNSSHSARDPNHPSAKVGANGLFNVFVGDLDLQVDDAALKAAFTGFATLEDAKVMLDTETGASRGFGFVMFKERQDAQKAISDMHGKPLLSRNMRLNWAHPQTGSGGSGANRKPPPPAVPLDYNEVVNQSPPSNVTVYVGNLAADVTTATLQEMFSPFGEIAEVRDHADPNRNAANGVDPSTHRGYGFVLFKTHESAARAIVGLNGKTLSGKQIKCSWGNEKRPVQNTTGNFLAGFPYGSPPFTNGYGTNLYFYHPQYSPFPMQAAPGLQAPGAANLANLANLPAGQAAPQFNAMWAAWNAQATGQWPPGAIPPGAMPPGSLPPGALSAPPGTLLPPGAQTNHLMGPMSFANLTAAAGAGAGGAGPTQTTPGALNGLPILNGGAPAPSSAVPHQQIPAQSISSAPHMGDTQAQFGTH